jgi:predicted nucleotidyltransferase
MKKAQHIKLQWKTISNVQNILKSFDQVIGIFLMGSHTKNEEGAFSDIDLGVVFKDVNRPGKEKVFNKIAEIHPLLCKLCLYDKNALYLYENGVRLDLDFLTIDDIKKWDLSKAKILYDPTELLKKKKSEDKKKPPKLASKPKWREEDGELVDWFFWMFRQVYCWTKRAEENKERSFDKLNSAQTSLHTIREKLIEMKVFNHGKWDYLINIDSDYAEKMMSTFTNLNPTNMLKTTRDLFDLFVNTLIDYCKKTGSELPTHKVDVMNNLFDEYDSIK